MSALTEVQGVILRYVVRELEGNITIQKAKFNTKLGENEFTEEAMLHPVIVFFPNGTSQVMERASAEKRGFLDMPQILNFDTVQDTKTPAGRFKNALTTKARREAWLQLEQAVIRNCTAKSGNPLPPDVTISSESVYFEDAIKEEKEEA